MVNQDRSTSRSEVWTIRGFGFLLLILMLVTCFGVRRAIDVDELLLYNPIYTYLQDGRMTFPVHGQPDYMTIHPPLHYLIVAWFMQVGLTFYYAQLLPPFLLFLLTLILVERGKFPASTQFGLMAGGFAGITLYVLAISFTAHFSVRPDVHLAIAWFAGLVALESARLAAWDAKRLFLGGLLLTFASGLHYFAAPGCLGLVVYAGWIVRSRGWAKATLPLLALMSGSLLVGIPYLVLFVIPDWAGIMAIVREVQQTGGMAEAVKRHLDAYAYLAQSVRPHSLIAFCLLPLTLVKIPAILIATPLLLVFPSTRGIALAGLPLPLFVLLYSQGKSGGYYFPEFMVYLTGLAIAWVELPKRWLQGRSRLQQRVFLASTTAIAVLLTHNWYAGIQPVLSLRPNGHEMELARAVSQQMLGKSALVGGRMNRWYVGGAAYWYDISADLLSAKTLPDLKPYLANFDAIAEASHMSNATQNRERQSLPSWYLDRTLQLKGFYFSANASNLSQVLLTVDRPGQIEGYAYQQQQLYHFREQVSGDTLFVAANCPAALQNPSLSTLFFNRLALPNVNALRPSPGERELITFLMARDRYQSRSLTTQCQIRDEIAGTLEPINAAPLLHQLHQNSQPIQFKRTLEEALVSQVRLSQPEPTYRAEQNWHQWTAANPQVKITVDPNQRGVKLKSNRSAQDVQIVSPAIAVQKNAIYRVDLAATVQQGGFSLTLIDPSNRAVIYSRQWCQPQIGVPFNNQFVINTKAHDQLQVLITNCNLKTSKTTKLELESLALWQAKLANKAGR